MALNLSPVSNKSLQRETTVLTGTPTSLTAAVDEASQLVSATPTNCQGLGQQLEHAPVFMVVSGKVTMDTGNIVGSNGSTTLAPASDVGGMSESDIIHMHRAKNVNAQFATISFVGGERYSSPPTRKCQ